LISLKKLRSITGRPLKRKLASLLEYFQKLIQLKTVDNWNFWAQILALAWFQTGCPPDLVPPDPAEAQLLSSLLPNGWAAENLGRLAASLRADLLAQLGIDLADWKMHAPGDGDHSKERHFPFSVFLEDLRSPYNLGSIFRTSEAFGVKSIFLSPRCPEPSHPRALRTSMGSVERVAWERTALENLSGPVFALELGGTPLDEFDFPPQGTVLVGSEEWGLSPRALEIAKNSHGLVSIPLYGKKASLNVSASVAILLQAWTAFSDRFDIS